MRNVFIVLFLLTTLLLAKNPTAFAALGDVIFNNVNKIENLKGIDEYKIYNDQIDTYVKDVTKAKKDGFALVEHRGNITRKGYLEELRKLVKTNDFFVRSVKDFYELSKKDQNSKLFSEMINTGLMDTKERKKEILDYYFAHQHDMNSTGVIKSFLDEDARLKARREAERRRYKTKKQREAERMKEIRENDKKHNEEIEKKLQEELQKKKEEIREYQKEELSKTI
jgi:hypothetical protein